MKNLNARIEMDIDRQVPSRFYDFISEPSIELQVKIAELILKKIAAIIQIRADLSQLKFEQVKKSLTGYHVLYQQFIYGVAVSGAWIRVDIDKEGKVFNIMNDLLPEKNWKNNKSFYTPKISVEQAQNLSCKNISVSKQSTYNFSKSELVYFINKQVPIIAWKLVFTISNPFGGEWKTYVDAKSGKILECINLLRHINGKGLVFDPNPVVKLNDINLNDNSAIPDNAYSEVILEELEETGKLDGKYVSTVITANRLNQQGQDFLFKREDRSFKEVMAYYHIDRVQRYIQRLGFDNIMNKQIQVDIDGINDNNSFYNSNQKSITFGTGGIDDAEDGEVIVHEYGHAILDDIVPGFGESGEEASAINEGFSDYLAASFFEEKKFDNLKPTFGNWNGVGHGKNPPCIRRLDEPKKFPRDFHHDAHEDGEIWSACLWGIRIALGKEPADKLIIQHLRFLTRFIKFETAANYLLQADQQLNQGINFTIIKSIFVERGILL